MSPVDESRTQDIRRGPSGSSLDFTTKHEVSGEDPTPGPRVHHGDS